MAGEATMSRILRAACFLLSILAPFASAISRTDFEKVVDFSVTLKTVAAAAAGEAALPANRLFILNGTVSEITFLNKEKASFQVRIRLISGEWVGLEEVKMYTCLVTFSGPRFFPDFPARPPKDPGPDTVLADTRILVVARALGPVALASGEGKVMAMEGLFLRVLP
jgi:hypothetical protein